MSVTQRVADGAKWLDERHIGWELEVDLGALDLGDECFCVLGQLVSHYDEDADYSCVVRPNDELGVVEMNQALFKVNYLTHQEAIDLGFHIEDEYRDMGWPANRQRWQELTDEWRRVIEQRREL